MAFDGFQESSRSAQIIRVRLIFGRLYLADTYMVRDPLLPPGARGLLKVP